MHNLVPDFPWMGPGCAQSARALSELRLYIGGLFYCTGALPRALSGRRIVSRYTPTPQVTKSSFCFTWMTAILLLGCVLAAVGCAWIVAGAPGTGSGTAAAFRGYFGLVLKAVG